MAREAFNFDKAEDFDDGTRAFVHENSASGLDAEPHTSMRLRSSRKHRLQVEREGPGKYSDQASALRIKNWEAEELLLSKEYAGRVVERKDLNDSNESPDEDAVAEWSDAKPFGTSDDEEVDEITEEDVLSEKDSESEGKSAETIIRGFQREDSARLMGTQDTEKVVEKAKHIRHQKIFWERCLEVQIYTKRVLTTMKNAMSHETVGEETDGMTANKIKQQIVAELYESIDAVSSLQQNLCNVSDLVASEAPMKKRTRTCDNLWEEITSSNLAMLPQYSNILNTYTRKTDLIAGGKNRQAKKFKAVNQDILSQVESVLLDPQRVKRKAHAPLENEVAVDIEDQLDELMYDDSDFYQQLLKEFIESSGSGTGLDAIRRTHRKKKKVVNRKASKGRQLRYTVHPKLENFMFPEPYPIPDMDLDELFRSLFGQVRQHTRA
ncbi:uncharacterized protein CCR75_007902 [Bremia lactucae]|uniref:Apoptosis-antagonizing transcription factor C-terminal domain-containing protein n=1 Tax=Bremia lactucae TaxID=4779 RepID=A0A976NZ01_BRELC|nr:hypothetical protein CCR75_007902 [Bremia lactucae]